MIHVYKCSYKHPDDSSSHHLYFFSKKNLYIFLSTLQTTCINLYIKILITHRFTTCSVWVHLHVQINTHFSIFFHKKSSYCSHLNVDVFLYVHIFQSSYRVQLMGVDLHVDFNEPLCYVIQDRLFVGRNSEKSAFCDFL
jgi:hypothetical protein